MLCPHRIPRLLLPALLSVFAAGPALAAWPSDPTVNVPLCTAASTQQSPESCSDGAGGAIVTWFDFRAGNYDVYVQRVSRDGVPLWTANGVAVCTATGSQAWPTICPDGAGGAILAWQDYRGSSYDIYVQRVNAAGAPQWTANGVALCTAAESQQGPEICTDGAGGAIVAWRDYRSGTDNNVYVRRINSSGTPQWTANGVALCTATGDQSAQQIVSDGAGGAIVAWIDYRSGANYDIYAQRVNTSGAVQWTANGIALCDATGTQWSLALAGDGAGGAVAVWSDYRNATDYNLYAQRVDAAGATKWFPDGASVCDYTGNQESPAIVADGFSGVVIAWRDYRTDTDGNLYAQRLRADGYAQWTANGVSLCTASGVQLVAGLAPDGSGGAIATWSDYRSGGAYVYARRVSATGSTMWTSNGVPLCTIGDSDVGICICPDDAGGAIAAWGGLHGAATYDIHAQRVDRFGAIGEAEPVIAAVEDVAGDQGGQVVVEWTASYLDADPAFGIESYSVWRQVPTTLVALADLADAATTAEPVGPVHPASRVTVLGAQTVYWEYVGSVPARAREGYSFLAATTTDSIQGSNPFTRFMVSAEASGTGYYWDSAPDSGYSVDDLAPPMPSPFTGDYASGVSTLQWGVSPAPDFAVFRLYRGSGVTFEPDAGNLIATLTTCAYTDDLGYPAWYKLYAVDIHGNVSPYAEILPNGAVDVSGPAPPRELALSMPAPNPLRGSTALRLALPRAASVSAAVYDQQGRLVRALLSGTQPAGEHTLRWDGRDEAGRAVPSGMYFVRCRVEGRALTRRIAALR